MQTIQHKFVDSIPEQLEEGTLYVSILYCTAIHKCICGCGNEVVTPLSPTDWQLSFNGETVSLKPSIGNWNFKCRSHYFITNDKIEYAFKWNSEEVVINKKKDKKRRRFFFRKKNL